LGLSKKRDNCEAIFAVMEQYLDKKEVKNVDLSVLEHVCVNKLRLLLREKMVVERELLNQLNDCNQKLHQCEQQLAEKNAATGSKVAEVITDNKRLTALVNTLQNGIKNLEKTLDDERRESEMQRNQVEINKRQFVEEIRKMKEELTTISSVTKSEFDRMKIENLKLA
jgi:flagellar biosynthesis chaperone FliJ